MAASRRWLWISMLMVALGAAGASGWYVLRRPASANGPVTSVVARRDLSATVVATGTIKAMVGAEVKVGSRIPGRVEELAVQVGDRVKAGQVIARLEQDDLRAAVEKARADLAAAEARLATVRNGARTQELQTAEAALRQAEANRLLAQVNLDRYRSLYQDGGIALQVVDTAARDYDVALAQVRAAREQLSLTREKYTAEDLRYAEAQVEQALAALRIAEANLGYATITAPMSGVVASVSTQQGETVTSGSAAAQAPTFVTIIDLSRLQVDAYVDETDIGKVHVGSFVAVLLSLVLVWTGFWMRIWVLFGGANQLMASLALMLVTIWLMSTGRKYLWAMIPMIFMFVTTVAALLYTSYRVLYDVATLPNLTMDKIVGNVIAGAIGILLLVAAVILAWDALRAIRTQRAKLRAAPAHA